MPFCGGLPISKLEIVNPVARAEAAEPLAERIAPAKRPATLAGETIGLFWNGKPQGDIGLARAREHLARVFEGVRFRDVFGEKGGLNRYASPAQIEQMASECAAVVAATAD